MSVLLSMSEHDKKGPINHTIEYHEIAYFQIVQAIECYEKGSLEGYICATTLGGAADEILGKLCRENGKEASLDVLLTKLEENFPEYNRVKLRTYALNVARDSYKHLNRPVAKVGDSRGNHVVIQ